MTWHFLDSVLLLFAARRQGDGYRDKGASRSAQSILLDEAAGARHLESLRIPHPLSGPGARVFNHLI